MRRRDNLGMDLPDGPLSPEERRMIRGMLEEHRRARWFWTVLRIWIIWLGAVAAALTAIKTQWGDLIKKVMS